MSKRTATAEEIRSMIERAFGEPRRDDSDAVKGLRELLETGELSSIVMQQAQDEADALIAHVSKTSYRGA